MSLPVRVLCMERSKGGLFLLHIGERDLHSCMRQWAAVRPVNGLKEGFPSENDNVNGNRAIKSKGFRGEDFE